MIWVLVYLLLREVHMYLSLSLFFTPGTKNAPLFLLVLYYLPVGFADPNIHTPPAHKTRGEMK